MLLAVAVFGSWSILPAQAAPPACGSLKSMQVPAASIALPTRGAVVTSAKPAHSGSASFCKVLGEIRSVDPKADPIRFELNLPATWNGKAVHFGGGAFDGTLKTGTNALGVQEVGVKTAPTPLQRGFATFGSDSGHHHRYLLLPDRYNAITASFAANPEQRLNYAHDALKKTHDAVVFLVERNYGSAPKRMFFIGGSTGGREAYFVTQLWPRDYDGVLGAYAGWNQVELDLQFIRVSQAEYRKGDRLTRGWLPMAKSRLVAARVMEACDALDGVKDGIIANPDACRFDLTTLACPPGKDAKDCLTPGQLQTLQVFGSEQRTVRPLAHGVQSIPGFNVTGGTDLTGSLGLVRHPFKNPVILLNSFYYVVGDGVLRFFLTNDPHYNALDFNPSTGGKYAAELLPQSLASDASDADLTPFVEHGGKLILLHGTTDATIPTNATVEFYRMLQAKMPPTEIDKGVRFFLVPGYGHSRGVFDAGFDSLGVLDRWVETGDAPPALTVVDNNTKTAGRTRPLCAWPGWPRYVAGDPNQAASFTCQAQTQ